MKKRKTQIEDGQNIFPNFLQVRWAFLIDFIDKFFGGI